MWGGGGAFFCVSCLCPLSGSTTQTTSFPGGSGRKLDLQHQSIEIQRDTPEGGCRPPLAGRKMDGVSFDALWLKMKVSRKMPGTLPSPVRFPQNVRMVQAALQKGCSHAQPCSRALQEKEGSSLKRDLCFSSPEPGFRPLLFPFGVWQKRSPPAPGSLAQPSLGDKVRPPEPFLCQKRKGESRLGDGCGR